jgi:hypothetical protein
MLHSAPGTIRNVPSTGENVVETAAPECTSVGTAFTSGKYLTTPP